MVTGENAASMLLNAVRRLGCGVLGLLLLTGVSLAFADIISDHTLFGPKQYVRSAGAPNTYADTFAAPAAIGGPFVLAVVNGTVKGSNRVTSGSIKVNGVQVAGPADFGQKIPGLIRVVKLGPTNTLEVSLAGSPEAYVTISVIGTRILPVPTQLTPNPLTLTTGASGTLTATLAPTPKSAGALSVVSANAALATVPSAVSFAAGQTSVTIPVNGIAPGNTTITASANGGLASATVQVTPAPLKIATLAPTTLNVTQFGSAALTVTISSAQSSDTLVAIASTDPNVAWVPGTLIIPAGQVSAPITVNALTPGTAQISASLNGSTATSQVSVSAAPPTVVALLPVVSSVTLGATASLTLTLSSTQAVPTVVALTVGPPGLVTVPTEVIVPPGLISVAVPVATLAYGQAGITASLNGTTASSVVNVVPPPVAVIALTPATFTLTVGATSTFTVTLNAAQTTSTEVALTVNQPSVLQAPASVIVAQGATSATFTVTALALGDATITAAANGTSRMSTVHVSPQPAAIVSLLPDPLPLQQGASGNLILTINVAQEIPTTISLTNSNSAVVSAPLSITLPAGALSAVISVHALTPGSAQITTSVNGASAASIVEVSPPPPVVTTVTPTTLVLPQGVPGVLRVTLSRAPNMATAVTLVSSHPSIVSVPPQVNVAAGALEAEFPVVANNEGSATITASFNGSAATSVVTITAAEVVSLTLSPQPASAYLGESVAFTSTATMTHGGTQDFTNRVTWNSSNSRVASIGASGVASTLAMGQATITAGWSFTPVLTGQPVTITQTSVLTVKQQVALVLSAPTLLLQPGQSTLVTVTSNDPAPTGGLVVMLTASGTDVATFPPAVTIPVGGTNVSFTVTAGSAGSVTLTAAAQNRNPGSITFTIQAALAIDSFTPLSGPVGTAVTLNGNGFDPVASNNQIRFNGELAVIVNATASVINVIAPLKATRGPISITNSRGTALSATPFTVQEREAFDITLAPAAVQVPPGGSGAVRLTLTSIGLSPYPHGAVVSVNGLAAGMTATLSRPHAYLNGDVIITFSAPAGQAAGTFPVSVTAVGATGLSLTTRSKIVNVQVLAAGSTTITGRVLHADDAAPFVGARVRLGATPVFSDETGTYRFVNPPVLGEQVLLIDGNTANTPQFEFPSGIAMPVNIVAGQDNVVLSSFIGRVDATNFTAIVPGQAATVTNAELPGFALNIPAGASIIGWDGQPVTKISVRKVPVDRLPIRPLPVDLDMKSVFLYYFFKEGGGDPTVPIPVTYPNEIGALPGEQVELWYYDESPKPDPNSHQWRSMGFGTVSADGKAIVSNPGVGIPKFCCGAGGAGRRPPTPDQGGNGGGGDNPKPCPAPPQSGNPVDLATGNALVFRPRPFGTMSVLMPVNLNCKYRSLDSRTGLFGRGMSFTYDWFAQQAGDAVRVTNPDGVQFMLSRGLDGVFRATSGHQGAIQMEVSPTATGRTLKLADGTQYEFDTPGRLIAVRDVTGNRITFSLNAQGAPVSLTDAAGKVYTFTVTTNPPLVTRITDPAGRFVQFDYDGNRRLIRYTDQGGGITQLGYDTAGRITQHTDPRGAVKTIEYDSNGRVVRELLPENGVESYAYNVVGNTVAETRHTDANGNTTTYRFNALGYTTQVTDTLGRVTRFDLDPINNLVRRRIDAVGRVTQFAYNPRGDTVRVIDAEGKQTLIDYDLRFRKPTRLENALGHVTSLEYNTLGKVTQITNAENETTTLTYTAQGQLASVTDALNRVTRFTYDLNGNLLESTNAAHETVSRVYDVANRLTEVTDALNRTTRVSYDALDRVTEIRDAALGLTRLTLDPNDNTISVLDPNNNPVERNVYDLRNRLTRKTDAKNLASVYAYDGVGNVISATDRKGQVTQYAYDAINRLTQILDADGRLTAYVYDLAGNLTRISDNRTAEVLLSYDLLDRLTQVVSDQGVIQYAYDALGRRMSRTLSGGDVTTYTYDRANRLKSVTLRGRTASYAYDAGGRLTQKTLPNGINTTYQYDAADRVTSIAYTRADGAAIETITYAYDAGGQQIQKSLSGSAVRETPFTATYDEANRLTQITLNGESFTITYDNNGNLTAKTGVTSGATIYTWTARNQLASIAGPSGSASFKYDALGRRIEKTVNNIITGFLYDGAQAIAELKGNALDTVYHTGLEIDEVLARYGASGNKTLLTDALMSVIAQTRDDQSIQNAYAFSPYGETQAQGSDPSNSLQYTGRENDGTGLYYYRARYYDPIMKRFMSEDPIGVHAGPNFYSYVGGNPISRTDPLGLDWFKPAGAPSVVGRPRSPIEPGDPVSSAIENWVPAGYEMGVLHDDFVDRAVAAGVPDIVANIPTIPYVYARAVATETITSVADIISRVRSKRKPPKCE